MTALPTPLALLLLCLSAGFFILFILCLHLYGNLEALRLEAARLRQSRYSWVRGIYQQRCGTRVYSFFTQGHREVVYEPQSKALLIEPWRGPSVVVTDMHSDVWRRYGDVMLRHTIGRYDLWRARQPPRRHDAGTAVAI